MKKILNSLLIMLILLGSTSCSEWLDVNTDPSNPNESSAAINLRLPWIQNYYLYAWGSASMRASTAAGLYTQTSTASANGTLASWNPYQSICTTAYQHWYLGGFVNIKPLMEKAEEVGAYHYIGAAYALRAMGTFIMLDLHGELPLSEANVNGVFAPKYDDGKTLYESSMADLDKAIECFGKTQESTAPALSMGDAWNGGDVEKWIKLCNGFKARYLLQVSKKSIYDGDAVLAALAKAPQANADNTYEKNSNVKGDTQFTFDSYNPSHIWNTLAWGATQRATRWYKNLLDNSYTGGSNVIDPRMDRLLPSIMTNIVATAEGKVSTYGWRVDAGVDNMNSDVRVNGGPVNASYVTDKVVEEKDNIITYEIAKADERDAFIAGLQPSTTHKVEGNNVTVTYPIGAFYINSTNHNRAGDTIYVNMQSWGVDSYGKTPENTFAYPTKDMLSYGAVSSSGTFYSRPDSDLDIVTYSEMCFIKSEVYLRAGDKASAYAAYIAGINANFDRMQTRFNEWGATNAANPFIQPMDAADITAYMASAAVVQDAANLTIADIIKQKIIALGPNLQVWNDMRRLNYSGGDAQLGNAYIDYKRPADFSATNKITGGSPSDATYWFRRFSQSTHESNYNNTNLLASHPHAMQDDIWCQPVWWDIAE